MAEEHNVTLRCCGASHQLIVNEQAILALDPDETRKNVVCPNCDRIVVLSFRRRGNVTTIDQEVI